MSFVSLSSVVTKALDRRIKQTDKNAHLFPPKKVNIFLNQILSLFKTPVNQLSFAQSPHSNTVFLKWDISIYN